jgi:5'-phosphate synthase pdxT subunit
MSARCLKQSAWQIAAGSLATGVLALQGDFAKHCQRLKELGEPALPIRTDEQLATVDRLIIPGGESTTMNLLAGSSGFIRALTEFAGENPVFGTCAGAIILANCHWQQRQIGLGLMAMQVVRNAYGRQVDSFIDCIDFQQRRIEAVYIRAPKITSYGANVRVLASYNGSPVLVQQGRLMASTFHPELAGDTSIHEYFLHL